MRIAPPAVNHLAWPQVNAVNYRTHIAQFVNQSHALDQVTD